MNEGEDEHLDQIHEVAEEESPEKQGPQGDENKQVLANMKHDEVDQADE